MPEIKFKDWLAARYRSDGMKGRMIAKLRQVDHPERLVLAVFSGKLTGVTKAEYEIARRIVWDFRRAGGVFADEEEARAAGAPIQPGSVIAAFGPTGRRRGRHRKLVLHRASDDEMSNGLIALWVVLGLPVSV